MRPTKALRRAAKVVALSADALGQRDNSDLRILLYHRVRDGDGEIDMPPSLFNLQLEELLSHHVVLSLDEALAIERGGVVITFDDGYQDFHETALPVLERHGLPVVLYLATRFVDDGGVEASSRGRLSWNDLQDALSTGLVTLGAHTHNHVNLAQTSDRIAEEEIRRSKELIEDKLGVACNHFSYPWAVGSPAADRIVRELFQSAALSAWSTNHRATMDRYRLGRIPVLRSDGRLFFRAKAKGFLNAERYFYRAFRRGPWRP